MSKEQIQDQVKVIVFCGGRGSANLTHALQKHPQVSLTLLVNAYDDGLSTGRLRQFIPGMLGPSDVRKNISRLIEVSRPSLSFLLDFRYPQDFTAEQALQDLKALGQWKLPTLPATQAAYKELTWSELIHVKDYVEAFLNYYQGKDFDFADCSIGNIFFAGCYLKNGRDFNRTIEDFLQFCGLDNDRVLNVTQGEGFVLSGLKHDGTILINEAEIVGPQSSNIEEIFLLPEYLKTEQLKLLASLAQAEKIKQLRSWECLPELNEKVRKKIVEADVIIYGPGTQYSSLLPSYLTQGLCEAITENTSGEKIFVSNILQDYDIKNEDANALVKKFLFYMGRKNQVPSHPENIVNQFFFQQRQEEGKTSAPYVAFDQDNFDFPLERVKLLDWESREGKHSGGLILDEILSFVQEKYSKKIKNFHHTVSIVVPALNEEKTVAQVLHQLNLLNFLPLGLEKEVIFVDGGSADRTFVLGQKEMGVRAFQLPPGSGRGQALRFGLEKCKGNIIVFFPSDNEYKVDDIHRVIRPILNEEAKVVLGSRAIKCLNLNKRITGIYGNNKLSYFISKYGGMMLSVVTLLLYNRYISDTLTTLKAFRRDALKKFVYHGKGVDFDLELLAKLCINGEYILEIPVDYNPRTKAQGKKISLFDGLRALLILFKEKCSYKPEEKVAPYEENFDHHSRL